MSKKLFADYSQDTAPDLADLIAGLKTADGSNVKFTLSDILTLFSAAGVITPTATILAYGGTAAPTGFLLCDGSAVSRTTYAALFAVVSTLFGVGNGTTTFNLPDLRGRVIAGQDDMGGTSANRLTNPASTTGGIDGDVLGGTGGAETHVITAAQLAAHTHSVPSTLSAGSSNLGKASQNNTQGTASNFNTNSTGSDAAHNNVQPTMILNYIIRI